MFSALHNSHRPDPSVFDWAIRLIPGASNAADITRVKDSGRSDGIFGTNYRQAKPSATMPETSTNHPSLPHVWRPALDFSSSDKTRRNVLIIGASAFGRRIATCIQNHPEQGRAVCGFLDDDRPMGNGVIGRTGNLARLSRTSFVDEVILAAPHDRELTLRVLRSAQRLHLDVEMAVDLFGCEPVRSTVRRVGGFPVICLHHESLPVARLLAKRAMDIAGAGLALLFFTPLLAAIVCLIKWDSPGRAIYSAPRVGRKGKPFRCHKFRTMICNADDFKPGLRVRNERVGPFFKIVADPRITRMGRWLRRYSLDELPQLWNVLRGEMSLVGPRPHPLDDFAAYGIEHLARLDVVPGITGLWQISARQDPSFEKGVGLDREYIESWSLAMDLRILFRTVLAVLRGSGE
ncbi:MAG TPA: sugar transferase [Candidatus Sulfotelmatobacter sp.]